MREREKERGGGRKLEKERERVTNEALLCLRESWGMRGGLEGETGGEMDRSWTLVGFEKEEERTWCWPPGPICWAEEARPS